MDDPVSDIGFMTCFRDLTSSTILYLFHRLDNLIFNPDKPEVLAVSDWELSMDDPVSDIGFMTCFRDLTSITILYFQFYFAD